MRVRLPLLERLDRRSAAAGDCIVWQGARTHDGYGLIRIGDELVYVMRAVWELHHGAIPAGLHVLHSCDNPPCIRVDHLMVGSQRANIQDMLAKGRRWRAA